MTLRTDSACRGSGDPSAARAPSATCSSRSSLRRDRHRHALVPDAHRLSADRRRRPAHRPRPVGRRRALRRVDPARSCSPAGSCTLRSALLAGMGIGLFIDEVGKFISAENDYFYPAAAPIIYATFLIAVLVWLRARAPRRPRSTQPAAHRARAVRGVASRATCSARERDDLRERLASAAAARRAPEQRRLAAGLLAFVEDEELRVAPDPVDRFGGLRAAGERAATAGSAAVASASCSSAALAGRPASARSWRWSPSARGALRLLAADDGVHALPARPPRGRGRRRRAARGRRRPRHAWSAAIGWAGRWPTSGCWSPHPGRPDLVLHPPVRLDRGRALAPRAARRGDRLSRPAAHRGSVAQITP